MPLIVHKTPSNSSSKHTDDELIAMEERICDFLEDHCVHNVMLSEYIKELGVYEET